MKLEGVEGGRGGRVLLSKLQIPEEVAYFVLVWSYPEIGEKPSLGTEAQLISRTITV